MASNVAPRVVDRVMRNYQYRSQVDERPAPPREQGALYHAIVAVSVVAALAPVFVALWVGVPLRLRR